MTITESSTLLDEVERLRPLIEEHSPMGELTRQVPLPVYDAMREAGLFRMLAPRAFGGLEVHPSTAYDVYEAVSRIDSSTGWLLQISQAALSVFCWLSQEGLEEIFASGPDQVVATPFFPPGAAVPTDGGYRVTTRGSFASGCHAANWVGLPCVIMDGDQPRVDPGSGQPLVTMTAFPRSEVEIIDTWDTVGMRGTFSADIAVKDGFVPERRTGLIRPLVDLAPAVDTPVYRLTPWTAVQGEAIVSVGIACAAIEALRKLATEKTPNFSEVMLRDRELAQHHVAKARALVDASRLYVHESVSTAMRASEAREIPLDNDIKWQLQLSGCFAAEQAAKAVDLVHEAVGSTGFRNGAGFERYFRDAHVLTQHASKNVHRYEDVGKMMYGLPQTWFALNL